MTKPTSITHKFYDDLEVELYQHSPHMIGVGMKGSAVGTVEVHIMEGVRVKHNKLDAAPDHFTIATNYDRSQMSVEFTPGPPPLEALRLTQITDSCRGVQLRMRAGKCLVVASEDLHKLAPTTAGCILHAEQAQQVIDWLQAFIKRDGGAS